MQAASDQSKPAATMNTCGAMMVGSNQSKEVSNDGEFQAPSCLPHASLPFVMPELPIEAMAVSIALFV